MLNKNLPLFKSHPKIAWLITVLVLAGAIFAVLELTNTTHVFNKSSGPTGSGSNSKPKTVKHGLLEGSSGSGTVGINKGKNPAQNTPANGPLLAPTGTFVNTYTAALHDQLTSTCNTTPDAMCQITFTRNGVTKALPARQADGNGAVFWAWHPDDSNVGLTVGAWHIVAVATQGSQSIVTDNGSLELNITQ